MTFATNVFINCPFDEEYRELLRPMLFTIIFVGLTPRIALESLDSGQPRIEKILKLVRESRFGIHDLSRIQARTNDELYRLNMPLELGIDFGSRRFGADELQSKRFLILESKPYRYQAAISDLAGSDIEVHDDKPYQLINIIRDWLGTEAQVETVGTNEIWMSFNDFSDENRSRLLANGFSIQDVARLSIRELIRHMTDWVRAQPV